MKRRAFKPCLIAVTAALIVSYISSLSVFPESRFGNSDEIYYNYANIDGAIDVPTLFVQDAGFVNDKSYPLVVTGMVEYAPVEVFLGFPGIDVVYAENNNDFYLQNKRLDLYISFDISGGYAISHSFGVMNLAVRYFNQTLYVPVKDTARSLGLQCSTYDDYIKSLYCVRVYDDSATKSFETLIDECLSKFVGYEPTDPPAPPDEEKPEDNTKSDDNTPVNPPIYDPDYIERQEEIKDEQIEEEKEAARSELVIGRRDVYLAFTSSPNENTEAILDSLAKYGAKAVFFCNADAMLKYPALVRRMAVEGHSIGLCPSDDILPPRILPPKDSKAQYTAALPMAFDTDIVISDIAKSQKVLYQLTKLHSRLLYTPEAVLDGIDSDRIYGECGVVCVKPNFETSDYTDSTRVRISAEVIDALWTMSTSGGVGNAVVLFNSTEKSSQSAERILDFSSARPQVRLRRLSESTDLASLGIVTDAADSDVQ